MLRRTLPERRWALRLTHLRGLALVTPPLAVIVVFVGLPIVTGLLYTLGRTGGLNEVISMVALHQNVADDQVITLDAYRDVFSDSQFRESLLATIEVTVAGTALTLALAWAIAGYLRFRDGRLSRFVAGASVVPMFVPVVIGAYAVLSFWAPNGFPRTLATHLGWSGFPSFSYTLAGVTIGSVWSNLPFATLLITSGLSAVPDAQIDAARDAGAGPWRRFTAILLPMTSLPTTIAATFTAIGILGSFTVPYIVGSAGDTLLGPLMSKTYNAFSMPQQAQVMAIVVFALALVAAIGYLWANFRGSRQPRGVR